MIEVEESDFIKLRQQFDDENLNKFIIDKGVKLWVIVKRLDTVWCHT